MPVLVEAILVSLPGFLIGLAFAYLVDFRRRNRPDREW